MWQYSKRFMKVQIPGFENIVKWYSLEDNPSEAKLTIKDQYEEKSKVDCLQIHFTCLKGYESGIYDDLILL